MKPIVFFVLTMTAFFVTSANACFEQTKPKLIDAPQPNFIFDAPKAKKATVVVEIHVDVNGKALLKKVISIDPAHIPEKPLVEAIKMARFTPSQTRNKGEEFWKNEAFEGTMTIELNWEQ